MAFERVCEFAQESASQDIKTKFSIAAFVDESSDILCFAKNTLELCAERIVLQDCPCVECDLVVVRFHKNGNGERNMHSQPCGKCAEEICKLPSNVRCVVWSSRDACESCECANIPKNPYRALNGLARSQIAQPYVGSS